MPEESNPIKDLLFEHIQTSHAVPGFLSEKRFDLIIKDVVDGCSAVMSMGDEAVGVLATGLLHYLLTNAIIPSQRKVEHMGVELDIVIPDIRTLEADPKKALLVCIPKSSDVDVIRDKITQLGRVQPEAQNIWVVLARDAPPIQNQKFILSDRHDTFSGIIFEISRFVSLNKTGKFKILQV